MQLGKKSKPPQLQACKTEVLFCLVAQEAPALLRHLTDQTVNTSNSARLECQVRGIPEPQISWFKNHEEIQQESGESSVYSYNFYSPFNCPICLRQPFAEPLASGPRCKEGVLPGGYRQAGSSTGAPGYSVLLQNNSQAGSVGTTGLWSQWGKEEPSPENFFPFAIEGA